MRDVFYRTSAARMRVDKKLENMGSEHLHGRQSKGCQGGSAGSTTVDLTSRYMKDREAVREQFEIHGFPFDRSNPNTVTHISSKREFHAAVCKEMIDWHAIGEAARDVHVKGGKMWRKMKKCRVLGWKCDARKVRKGTLVLRATVDTFRLFTVHNEKLPAAKRMSVKDLAAYELGRGVGGGNDYHHGGEAWV